jgi:transketolase
VLRVDDVNDLAGLDAAIEQARAETARPTLIAVGSHIGYGSPKQDDAAAHGAPLGAGALAAARDRLGWRHPPFVVPADVAELRSRPSGVTAWPHEPLCMRCGASGTRLHRELELHVEAGMTPMEAIQSATIVPARAMRLDHEAGNHRSE